MNALYTFMAKHILILTFLRIGLLSSISIFPFWVKRAGKWQKLRCKKENIQPSLKDKQVVLNPRAERFHGHDWG
jgi:type III secretory pathway component EscU